MLAWLRQLDDLLRGRKTAPALLAEGRVDLPPGPFVTLALILGAIYGCFMGWYAISIGGIGRYMQLIASTVKLPALFLLTLVVTFPSLYVFNALVGCRLSFTATLRLLVGAVVVNVTVAASFGPILGFFTLSTESYPFMILLNVTLLSVAGLVGLAFLLHTLRRLATPRPSVPPVALPADTAPADQGSGEGWRLRQPGPLDRLPGGYPDEALGQARLIFQIWVIIYGLVGAQMGWLLRPFIGSPDLPFEWFRQRQGNFFQAVYQQAQNLFGG